MSTRNESSGVVGVGVASSLGLSEVLSLSPLSFLDGWWHSLFVQYPEWQVFLVGSFLVTTLAFWGTSLLFLMLDLTGQPSFLLRYKTQAEQNSPLEWADLVKGLKRVGFNSWVLNPLLGLVLFPLTRGPLDRPLPALGELVFHLVMFLLVEEVCFYYSHRLFHSPYFYKRFHKIHHEWTAPIAMAAIYAHPLEHILSNLLPVAAGPLLMGSHIVTMWIWFAVALVNTCYSHSGYHFPFTLPTQFHDYHHLKFSNNFGVLGVLDYLHGTDSHYRASPQFKNDRPFFSFAPVWDLTDTTTDIRKAAAKIKSAETKKTS